MDMNVLREKNSRQIFTQIEILFLFNLVIYWLKMYVKKERKTNRYPDECSVLLIWLNNENNVAYDYTNIDEKRKISNEDKLF